MRYNVVESIMQERLRQKRGQVYCPDPSVWAILA